jgi:dipeptidyl-peptidase 4
LNISDFVRLRLVACSIGIGSFAMLGNAVAASAQISPQGTAALNDLYGKPIYRSKSFGPARWIDGGAKFTTVEEAKDALKDAAKDAPKGQEIIEYDTATGARKVLVSAATLLPAGAKAPLSIDDYTWSPDNKQMLIFTNTKRVWRANTRGDYWLLDLPTGKLRKLGGDGPESTMMFAKFSPDGKSVGFVRAYNIYVQDLATDAVRALTTNGTATLINGTSDWVNEEELAIRDAWRWSPDSKSIAYWQFDTTGVGMFTLINDTAQEYPTTTVYPYPQPGTANSAVRVGVVAAQGGETKWMELPGDPRQHYVASVEWLDDSSAVLLQYLNRLQNTNDVLRADAKTGQVKTFFEDKDEKWVDARADRFSGGGAKSGAVQWVNHGKGMLWLSERDGWRHAYLVSRTTGEPQLITRFDGDVMEESAVDEKGGWFYFIASPENATQRYLYRVKLDGGTPERVTPRDEAGAHDYDISPDGEWAFHRHSTFNQPTVTDLIHLPDHKVVRVLEANTELAAKVKPVVSATASEFLRVPVANHVTLDGWMIKPKDFDPAKKYPVLVYVYGEPASTTVNDRWSNQRLYFAAIANEGYIVVSFDNQGTPAPKGREWRKAVYGSVGVLSAAQQADAIRELGKEHSYIDMTRLAVWGHSGGGSNTLNLMFRSNGLFKAGIALAPVADESHYDTIYQERYMGLPQENVQGYHNGSPINFAEGLQGHLLVMHGSGDDNVHYQGTELLINRLVELGKQFDFMEYPNRTHGINEGKGTSLHLYTTLVRYLEEHVPAGGVAQ